MSTVGNLATYLEHSTDTPALIVGGRQVSYPELAEQLGRWRGGLAGAGVRPGDRVAVVAGNSLDFVAAHLASLGIGAISVPLNPQSPASELARELATIDPFAVVVDTALGPLLSDAVELVPNLEVQVLTAADLDSGQSRAVVDVEPGHAAVLLFTSGTAGLPKPAILTHDNLAAGLQAVLSLPVDLVGGQHVFLGVIPLFHVFGLNMVLHLALMTGSTLVLDDFTDPPSTIEAIRSHQVTVMAGPPTLWRALSRVADAGPDDLASLQLAVSGAAKLSPRLKVEVADRFDVDLSEGYGLTESSAVVAASIATDAPAGSVGRLLPGVEARIVDDQGRDCLVGDPGELRVRGPMVFPGYWGAVKGTGPRTEDGWLLTGDVAVVDDNGYLAIVDRRKDLIIVSGFNVFPAEVESVLASHSDVAEVGVVGEPSESTGEAVVAFVVPEEGVEPSETELRRHCEAELARYKVPHRFVIRPDLPVGPTGKLQRVRLT